jgi:hypothetical protein
MIINDNKYVDSNQRLSQEIKTNFIYKKKLNIYFN